jgi:CubicO group peptidase (beta-lactamase class C family)
MSSNGSTARRVSAAIAILLLVAAVVVWSALVWLVKTAPIHATPAAIESTPAIARTDRYGKAIEDSRRLARALLFEDNLPGVSLAVSVGGEIVWAEAFGWSDVESRTPLTPRTRVRLGAASKPLTAVAAALLDDRGHLDFDAPVQRYVPGYPQKQWAVTIRQLMEDVAGVQRIRGDNNDAMPNVHCESLDEAVALLRDDPLGFQPGTKYRYSIWGWVLVSAAVEGAAREPFDRFMTRQVFEPLGMHGTVTEETPDLEDGPARLEPPRALFGVRFRAEEVVRHDYSCLGGAGAFLSTPLDLARFGSVLVTPGFLKAETIAELQTPGRLASGETTTYALGWTVGTIPLAGRPVPVFSHRGTPVGATVSLLVVPDRGLTIAAAATATSAAGVPPFARRVAEAFTSAPGPAATRDSPARTAPGTPHTGRP